MDSARRELDRMSHEAWSQLASDVKSTSQSMGRVGLSYARRHPALLLGGGALLGLGAITWFTRSRSRAKVAAPQETRQVHTSMAPTHGLWSTVLKSAIRMGLLDMLTSEFRIEKDDEQEDGDEEHADEEDDDAHGDGIQHDGAHDDLVNDSSERYDVEEGDVEEGDVEAGDAEVGDAAHDVEHAHPHRI